MVIYPKSKRPRKGTRKGTKRSSGKATKRRSRKRSTMGKNIINPRKYPIDIDINEIRENYFGIINNIAKFEQSVDKEFLNQLVNIERPDNKVSKLMIECANDFDDENAECINYIRQLKEMVNIMKLSKTDIDEKLYERLEFRKERLFRLKYLTETANFYNDYEILEKIDKIVKETGGLEVELNFQTPHSISKTYKELLGSRMIDLYKEYKKSTNIKSRDKIREVIEKLIR
jgi:hypothetical protein